MWSHIIDICSKSGKVISCKNFRVDFEFSVHKVIKEYFPDCVVKCCTFHIGQAWWRKIQSLGLCSEYCNAESDIGKWLTNFFGLPFLKPDEIEDCFVEDLFSEAPQDSTCEQFADYVLNTCITDTHFPPTVWAEEPSETKRTNNGAESFHARFNEQFYIHHPTIFIFIDVLTKIEATTYIKIRAIDNVAIVNRKEKQKIDFVIDMFNRKQSGNSTKFNFVKSVSYRFRARTDIP
jgi:hypothetical protein